MRLGFRVLWKILKGGATNRGGANQRENSGGGGKEERLWWCVDRALQEREGRVCL